MRVAKYIWLGLLASFAAVMTAYPLPVNTARTLTISDGLLSPERFISTSLSKFSA